MISLDEKKTNEMLDLLNIYTPLRDEVVIEIPSEDDLKNMKTGAGIIIGGKVAKEEYMYTILAAGPECKRLRLEIK
jgi:co-chaperonin GroES (HSP10)